MLSVVKDREAMLLRDLGPHDVLLGRGTGPNENPGNRLFRDEVRKGEDEYCRQSQSRVAKDLVVLQTIEAVRERGGRFVRRVRLCKKRKNATNSAPMKRNQQECCDLYEVESKRDIVIEKVRQAFQYCRRRPTQTDKRSTKTNKLSLKSSPDELLLEAKKTSNSSRWQQTPTTTSSSTRRRTAATGTAGTTRPTTSCSLEVETQRHAAVSLREQSAGADEQVQRAILIASIMGKAFEEQQGGALYGAGGADAPSISILQQRVDGGAPVQDPTANSRRNTSPGTSSLFDLGSRSSYSSYYPSMNAAVTTTPPVPNLLQFLSMGTTAKSVVAPSNAFFAYPFSAPTSSLTDNGGTLTHAPAATRGSSTTFSSPHQQQALAAALPSGMRVLGGVGLQQQLSNVLEDHHHLLIKRIRKVLFENPRPTPAPPLIYSLFQDASTITRPPNSEYY